MVGILAEEFLWALVVLVAFFQILFSCPSPSSVLVSDAAPTPRRHYSCIILNLTHDTLCLTRSWLISPRSCNMLFHWPLLDSFSQDGLYCNDKPVQRSNDRHGGRDEMDKTPKYPQHPSAFSFRNS